MGLIDKIPAMAVIQAEGCSPMVQAFKAGKSVADPVIPETRMAILSTGDPGKTYTYLWKLIQQFGGTMESVSDGEAFTAMKVVAKLDGLGVEPATAVAFAGLQKMLKEGIINKNSTVVFNCTRHTFSVEKHVLGGQWGVDLELGELERPTTLREGLQAALEHLDEKTTTVLIIDDNPDDAHLIRRILESRKSYRVFHTNDSWDGLAQARQRLPDLIVLDLMMPQLDGFGVLEELKLDKRTRHIPIIVVSAKDISVAERKQLEGQIEALYQKGSLPPRKFAEQVIAVIEGKSANEGES